MLVYANVLELIGTNPAYPAIKAIDRWINAKLGLPPTAKMADVLRHGERSGRDRNDNSVNVRTYVCRTEDLKTYCWRIKHPDLEVRGRQWVVLVGLRDETTSATVTVRVDTDDQSTLVSSMPHASRPGVVQALLESLNRSRGKGVISPDTIGVAVKTAGADVDSYRGLLSAIEDSARTHPIVLVSPHVGRPDYPIDPSFLQDQLIGLAQVVALDPEFDSREMSEVMGESLSAWNGALNIIRPVRSRAKALGYVVLERVFEGAPNKQRAIVEHVLARVTHLTNVPKSRKVITPEQVLGLDGKRRLAEAKARLDRSPDDATAQKQVVQDLFAELERFEEELKATRRMLEMAQDESATRQLEVEILNDERRRAEFQFQSQIAALQRARGNGAPSCAVLLGIALSDEEPSPEQCLRALLETHGGEVAVLDSAWQSAAESASFKHGRRLLDMLIRLVSKYLPLYIDRGDHHARSVFTNNEYAAQESDTVVNNRSARGYRTFNYNGQPVEMLRHLKIGVPDNVEVTIRVHFFVDSDNRKMVIGHCGPHLPLPGRT